MDDREIDGRIDLLFAGDPAGFTAARDALARELRSAGHREAADRVKALRRPSRIAAELNRLARERAPQMAAALAAQDSLASAQARVLTGEGDAEELRLAAEAENAAVAALTGDNEVRAALRLAARSDDARDDLARGRLTRDPQPDPDAGLFGGGMVAVPRPRPARLKAVPAPARDDLAEVRERRRRAAEDASAAAAEDRAAALAAAREALRAADAEARAAGRALREATKARDVAAGRRDRLAARVDDARLALAGLEVDLAAREVDVADADAALVHAGEAARAAEARRAEAERRLDGAGDPA